MKKIIAGILLGSITMFADVGTLSYVIDGDTVKMGDKTLRLSFIDTPESKSNARAKDKVNSCTGMTLNTMVKGGVLSKDYLKSLLKRGKQYKYDVTDKDRYGRFVALIYLDNKTTVNELLVKNGYATPFYKYIKDSKTSSYYSKLYRYAKSNNLGLFKVNSKILECLE